MTSPSRPNVARRGRRGAVQLLVGIIVLFGLVASSLLVFTDNLHYVRVGLVSALWAAAVGALAMTRYRRELAVEGAKVRDLQTVYQLQLEREVSARREFELGVESRVRKEVQIDVSQLAALRAELAELRKNLHLLLEGDLLVERPALRADSTRLQELSYSNGHANGYRPHRAGSEGQPPPPIFPGSNPANPVFAGPYDEPVTAETSAVEQFLTAFPAASTPEPDPRGWDRDSVFTETAEWSAGLGKWSETGASHPEDNWSPAQSHRWQETQPQPWRADQDWDNDLGAEAGLDTDPDDGNHTTGLTVAQIMANLRSEGATTGAGSRTNRHSYQE